MRYTTTLIFFLASANAGTIFNVQLDCGAVPDNSTLNTYALNSCVKRASPGDTLLVPRGVFLTGQVSLTSGLTLLFGDGGWLQGSANASDYGPDWDYWHVLQAVGAEDVTIESLTQGGGGIVGPMWQMVKSYDPVTQFFTPVSWAGVAGCIGECRPKNLALIDSPRATLKNFALKDSSDWTMLIRRSSHTVVDGLYIRGSQQWGNNDGMDIESGTNYTLKNLDIQTGDDCIAMRSGNCNTMRTPWVKPLPPLSMVTVFNCTLSSSSSAIKVEALFEDDHGDVSDVHVSAVTIRGSNRGVGVWQRVAGPSGGAISNLTFRDMDIETRYMNSPNWWGSGEALVVTTVPENPAQAAHGLPGIDGVVFENIVARAEGGCLFSSRGQATTSPTALRGLVMRNVSLVISRSSPFAHPQLDFRPVDAGGGAPPTVPSPVSGLIFEGLYSGSVEACSVAFEGPKQPFWAGPGHGGVCVSGNVSLAPDFQCKTE